MSGLNSQQEPKLDTSNLKQQITSLQSQLKQIEELNTKKYLSNKLIETIYKWRASDRIVFKRSSAWYLGISILFVFGIIFALLTRELFLMIALIAVMLLVYIANISKPNLITTEITTRGITHGKKLYSWDVIKGFWISLKGDQLVLMVNLDLKLVPNRLMIPIGAAEPKRIVKELSNYTRYLIQREIGEDIINVFMLGKYVPISEWIGPEGETLNSIPDLEEIR